MANYDMDKLVLAGFDGEHVDDTFTMEGVKIDNTLSVTGRAADAKKTGDEIGALKEDLSAIIYNGYYDYSEYVSGKRTTATPNVVSADTTRCTTKRLFYVNKGDVIKITNNTSGQKYGLVSASPSFDSGWQTGDYTYTVPTSAYFFVNITNTSDGAINPSDVGLIIKVYDNTSRLGTLGDDIKEISDEQAYTQAYLFGSNIPMSFELGTISYRDGQAWDYINSTTTIRTPQSKNVHLYAGTKIGLTDYTNAKFYVGWIKTDGTPTFSLGWKTSDYTVTEEGDYSIIVTNLTATEQSSVTALASLVRITSLNLVTNTLSGSEFTDNKEVNPAFLAEKYTAHKGCAGSSAPENTIPGFKWAIDSGYKILEFDIRFTSDNVPVIIHDDTINRTARNADGTQISETIYVANSTYEDLLEYDFGIWRGEEFEGTKIPTLEEFLVYIKRYNCAGDMDLTTLGSGLTSAQIGIIMTTVKKNGMIPSIMFTSNGAVIGIMLNDYPNIIACISNQGIDTLDSCATIMRHARLASVSIQYPYDSKTVHDAAHNLGLYTKAFTFSNNTAINTELGYAPDWLCIDTLAKNEIVIS